MKVTRKRLDTLESDRPWSTAYRAYRLDSDDGRTMFVVKWESYLPWEAVGERPVEIDKWKRRHSVSTWLVPTFPKLDAAVNYFSSLCGEFAKESR